MTTSQSNLLSKFCFFCSVFLWLLGCNGGIREVDNNERVQTEVAVVQPHMPVESSTQHTALKAAVQWLISQLGDDGLWRSEYYGNLKSGTAVTAFVLYSLSHLEPGLMEDHRQHLQKAVNALQAQIDKNGFVSSSDGPDYANYASAMLLVAADRLKLEITSENRSRIVSFLVNSQIGTDHGYDSSSVEFGGWDLSGWMLGERKTAGTNISVSSCVVEALSLQPADSEDIANAIRRANDWLAGCQNLAGDGGFFFHPQRDHLGNKAGWSDEGENSKRARPRSYGTTTCDGLRMLIDCGEYTDGQRFKSGFLWLKNHMSADVVPGFAKSDDKSWEQGLRFYFYFSFSKLTRSLPDDFCRPIAGKIIESLNSSIQTDGFWQNSNARMREDDPIIATGFAIVALAELARFSNESK